MLFIFRSLREKWETFSDSLSDSERKLEVCLLQWSSYDDSFDQFQRWLNEVTDKVASSNQLQATLPEKKAQLQNHKVGVDCSAHKSVFWLRLFMAWR